METLKFQYLGDVLGSLRHFGACAHCRSQFMSTHDRVLVVGSKKFCVNCVAYLELKGAGLLVPALKVLLEREKADHGH